MAVTSTTKLIGDVMPIGKYAFPIIGDTLEGQAISIARKYGASVYLPGVENFSDSALTSVATNDGSVGGVKDGKTVSSFPATQATAGFKPLLKSASRPHYWLFDGTDDRLSLSGPLFQMSDDHFVVVCAKRTSEDDNFRRLFTENNAGFTTAICSVSIVFDRLVASWIDDAATTATIDVSGQTSTTTPFVVSATKAGNQKTLRKDGNQIGTNSTSMGAATVTFATLFGRGDVGRFFRGNGYGVIAGKGTITDAELLILERYLGSLGGLTL